MAPDPSRSPFPFWRTVIDAHIITIENIGSLARIGWLWGVLIVASAAVLNWVLWPLERAAVVQGYFGSWTMLFVPALVSMMLGACVAVPWHRLLLKGEVVTPGRLGGFVNEVLAYFNVAVIMFAAVLAPIFLFTALIEGGAEVEDGALSAALPEAGAAEALDGEADDGADGTADSGWFPALLLIAGATAIIIGPLAALSFVPARFALLLPAIATSNRHFGLVHSWRATRGFFWRLYLGGIVCLSMPLVLTLTWFSVVGIADESSRTGYVREAVALEAIFFVGGMVVVTFLSMAYRKLAPQAETTTSE